jgi:hypothetical protein
MSETLGAASTATTSTTASAPILGGASTATVPDTSAVTTQATTTTTASPAAGPWNWTKEDGSFSDGWRDRLPDDLKGVKDLEKYKDLTSVLRSNVHAQKMIGADKVPIPGKDAKPEDWNNVWNKLGRPETPDKYDLKALAPLDKSIPYDYDGEKAMVAKMHALGMTQSQVAGLLSEYRGSVGGSYGTVTKQQADAQAAQADAIRKEYGQAFTEKMTHAENFALDLLGEEAGMKLLTDNRTNPEFIRLLVKASEATREDSSARGKSTGLDGALTPAEAKAEIEQLKMDAHKDDKHPLRDKSNPGYAAAQARWAKLHTFVG